MYTEETVQSLFVVCGNADTYGSPMTKESPVLIEGIKPKEPTRAAAASLMQNNSSIVYSMIIDYTATHEIMSPYRFGATMTSKILRNSIKCLPKLGYTQTYCGSRKSLK